MERKVLAWCLGSLAIILNAQAAVPSTGIRPLEYYEWNFETAILQNFDSKEDNQSEAPTEEATLAQGDETATNSAAD